MLNRVRSDRNCTLRTILKSTEIDENQHLTLREALTNICKETNFKEEILKEHCFKNKDSLIE